MTSQTVKRTKAGKKAKPARKDAGKNAKAVASKPDLAVGPVAQPSTSSILQEAFFAKFMVYFASDEDQDLKKRMTWLHVLPSWSADGSNPALTLAVRATSLAYTGAAHHDLSVLQEACTMYGKALHSHQIVLASSPDKITARMVSTSVMLSLFEAMLSTNGEAYREHIYGAAKMFDIFDIREAKGVMWQLFFHIRTQMSFVYLTTSNSQKMNVKKILTETLKDTKLPVIQKLLTHVAQLAEVYLAEPFATAANWATYSQAKSEITESYQAYQERGQQKDSPPVWKDEYGRTTYRDSYTTMAMSFFHAGHILISVLAYRLGDVSYADVEDHCEPILECARILESKHMGCSYMQMAMPLYLVALHGSLRQQDEAYKLFEGWRAGGMAGISYLALETIPKRRGEEFFKDALVQHAYSPEYLPIRSGVLEIDSESET
jgi:hypothetical protein